jgi:cyclopropane-fatty-acyl-phospholipid synthase
MTFERLIDGPVTRAPGIVERLSRRLVIGQLGGFRGGEITVVDALGETRVGEAGELSATLRVRDPRFYRQIAFGGSLAAAAAYGRGDWNCDNLTALFRLFARNEAAAEGLDGVWSRFAACSHRIVHRLRANTRAGSDRNIRAHYDLGNEFFQLWLDESLAYSCGIFPAPGVSLRDASIGKFDRLCRKLDLRATDHLLEIGTGWGGMAIHAAEHYGCRVTTTTISKQQFALAAQRIEAAGLSDRITLLLEDYRDLEGQFDKLVSIEMIEAVGHQYLDTYFRKCAELLEPNGSLVLQAIVMPERRYEAYLNSVDFIRRYIFPGGSLPSMAAMLESVGRASRLRFVEAEDFAPHYAETLRIWRESFRGRLADVRRLGYPEELIRLWEYYFCYCEAAFEERSVGVVQIQFDNFQRRRDSIATCRPAAFDHRAIPRDHRALRYESDPTECAAAEVRR